MEVAYHSLWNKVKEIKIGCLVLWFSCNVYTILIGNSALILLGNCANISKYHLNSRSYHFIIITQTHVVFQDINITLCYQLLIHLFTLSATCYWIIMVGIVEDERRTEVTFFRSHCFLIRRPGHRK